jgi:hypothetical protein
MNSVEAFDTCDDPIEVIYDSMVSLKSLMTQHETLPQGH